MWRPRWPVGGAVTGLVVGIASAFGIVTAVELPDNLPVSAAELFATITGVAVLLSMLGQLLVRRH
ncbi:MULTISPECIES: hypothetical protein [Pseudomonadaceae]|uniref:Uncharacterized protein n=1 Tax=Ectopseudomonas oleovorans TaxID=301 RepID=A0A2T5PK56_ECTOL|nr:MULTISPECIES: hypothetical protein [Pseudomonas]WGL62539.1 hypothetical protein QDX81_16370 [Pseudomonas sp. CW003PS]MCR1826349.1 hypothetical protein [Pseudomonas oleovorans]MDH0567538.1 hypothetical protein [Pseudomonas oleovorans]MDH2197790.1 hypothetical protein [Pseudomonas oleovorans]PTU78133.1 hypothetical protein DBO86_16350 [Pseudomonas indoloxydans]